MVCEKSAQLMMLYMDGLLDDFEEMNLTKHMESCSACREDFAAYKEMLEGFSQNKLEIIEAPEGFATAVMEKIEGINLYFPEKVRSHGKIFDDILFGIWGSLALLLVAGTTLFLYQEQILYWLAENGLTGLYAAVYPVANFVTQFGNALGGHVAVAHEWLVAATSAYGPAFLVALAGLAVLTGLVLYLSPKYAAGKAKGGKA